MVAPAWRRGTRSPDPSDLTKRPKARRPPPGFLGRISVLMIAAALRICIILVLLLCELPPIQARDSARSPSRDSFDPRSWPGIETSRRFATVDRVPGAATRRIRRALQRRSIPDDPVAPAAFEATSATASTPFGRRLERARRALKLARRQEHVVADQAHLGHQHVLSVELAGEAGDHHHEASLPSGPSRFSETGEVVVGGAAGASQFSDPALPEDLIAPNDRLHWGEANIPLCAADRVIAALSLAVGVFLSIVPYRYSALTKSISAVMLGMSLVGWFIWCALRLRYLDGHPVRHAGWVFLGLTLTLGGLVGALLAVWEAQPPTAPRLRSDTGPQSALRHRFRLNVSTIDDILEQDDGLVPRGMHPTHVMRARLAVRGAYGRSRVSVGLTSLVIGFFSAQTGLAMLPTAWMPPLGVRLFFVIACTLVCGILGVIAPFYMRPWVYTGMGGSLVFVGIDILVRSGWLISSIDSVLASRTRNAIILAAAASGHPIGVSPAAWAISICLSVWRWVFGTIQYWWDDRETERRLAAAKLMIASMHERGDGIMNDRGGDDVRINRDEEPPMSMAFETKFADVDSPTVIKKITHIPQPTPLVWSPATRAEMHTPMSMSTPPGKNV